jgi:hypothetical protein
MVITMKMGRDADAGGADRFPTRRLSAFPESASLFSHQVSFVMVGCKVITINGAMVQQINIIISTIFIFAN